MAEEASLLRSNHGLKADSAKRGRQGGRAVREARNWNGKNAQGGMRARREGENGAVCSIFCNIINYKLRILTHSNTNNNNKRDSSSAVSTWRDNGYLSDM